MIIAAGGVTISLKDQGDRVVVHSKSPRGFERDSLRMWAALARAGTTVIDIGAYTGVYALIAAKLGAKVVAIEPLPRNVKRLRINALENRLPMQIIEAACSYEEGIATLGYNDQIDLTSGASLEKPNQQHATIKVSTITVDALALTGISAIKIDVERHEPAVILGAVETIRRERPALMIETLDDGMRETVADLLPGYEVAAILDGRNTVFTPK